MTPWPLVASLGDDGPINVVFASRATSGLRPTGLGSLEPAPPTSSNSFYF